MRCSRRTWIARDRLAIQESAENLLLSRGLDGVGRRTEVQQRQDADARAAIEVRGQAKCRIRAHEVRAVRHRVSHTEISKRRHMPEGAVEVIAPIRRCPAGTETI